jgi:N-acetylglutamate synthase-like GNAT family acetyltransferase
VHFRKAHAGDIPCLLRLINDYAAEGKLLRRTEESIREGITDFTLAEEGDEIVACGALMTLGGPHLGEIRSLAVRKDRTGGGIGRRIVEELVKQAPSRGFADLLVLTRRVKFFEDLGFTLTRRELFLDKLMVDCQTCPMNLCCDETALTRPVPVADPAELHPVSEGEA